MSRILLITWNADGQNKVGPILPGIVNRCIAEFKKLYGVEPDSIIICLQEVSIGGVQQHKFGGKNFLSSGTDKTESANQKCNTAVLYQNNLSRQNRHTIFTGNRYSEGLKLKFPGNVKPIWVFSVHRQSMGPQGYPVNGRGAAEDVTKLRRQFLPMIYIGDMNCQPADVPLAANIFNSGLPTRRRSNPMSPDPELDFAIAYDLIVVHLCNDAAGGQSDHAAVAFVLDVPNA